MSSDEISGKLFGLLRRSIKFGDLIMYANDDIHPNSIGYQWRFKAGERLYCCEYVASFEDIEQSEEPLEHHAERISEGWKRKHRKQLDSTPGNP